MNTHLYEEIKSIDDIIKGNTKKVGKLAKVDDYTSIMKKEDRVLNMLDDVHQSNLETESLHKYFITTPIHVIIFKTFNILTNIYSEIGSQQDVYQIINLFLKKGNVIYVGVSLVILSFLLMFITI